MEEEKNREGKKVRFDDWMGSDSEDERQGQKKESIDKIFAADKFSKQDKKGHLLL